MNMLENIANAIDFADEAYVANYPGDPFHARASSKWAEAIARAAIATLREPAHAITRAMAESRAKDDEGEFPILLDLLDFSGENKAHTVLAQAWRDGIDAVLRDN